MRIHSNIKSLCIAAIVVLAAGGGGCSKSRGTSEATPPEEPTDHPASGSARASVNGKGPSGTMILLEPLFQYDFPPAAGPAYMDQSGLAFIPEFLAAQANQSVRFRNSDEVLHNVRVQETGTQVPVFNVATTPSNSYSYTFEKPGYYDVSCDIHLSMRATIVVTSTPYTGIADSAGQFAFNDVVPGQYTVKWFENGKQQDKQVDIQAPSTHVALP